MTAGLMPDMEEYLRQHDLIYEAAPVEWSCGIPLANGDIGALIWGDGNPLKITLDKYDAWELRTSRPRNPLYSYAGLRRLVEEHRFDEARSIFSRELDGRVTGDPYPTRIPLPRIELEFTEHAEGFTARLSIYRAIASGKLGFGKNTVSWRAFVHSEKNLLIVQLQYGGDVRLKDVRVRLDHLDEKARETLKKWGYPEPVYGVSEGCSWLKQAFPAGGGYVVAWRRVQERGKGETLFFSVLSFNDSPDPVGSACRLIKEALENGVEGLLESHMGFWREFWEKCFIAIPDSRLENLFYVELYKLACCSKGRYPCSLQGLWTQDGVLPPWSGDYHLDMNVEETYWPIYASNHLELGEPLYEQFWRNLPRFKEMCREFFGFEGAWSRCEMALDGTPIYGYYTANFWPGNGAWLAHMYWLHWLYSQDEKFLRERAYPFMRAFMQTYMNLLELRDDGRYHLPLSCSPEWGEDSPEAWGSDTTCDLALIRWLAESLLETVRILGVKDPDAERWREVLSKLADYPQDRDGLQIFRGQPLTHSHRHHSHLMAIHPLGVLNIEGSEADRVLIERSIRTWIRRGTGEWTGWSFPWASLIAARVRRGNMAWHMLQTYFYFIKPNTFHVNGDYRRFGASMYTYEPMTLEAGFCAAAAVMEMLLQSWGRRIRVFPAIPDFWSDVYFHRLRAEGAFLVTAKMEQGKVRFVIVESLAGRHCVLLNPFKDERALIIDLETGRETVAEGGWFKFNTVAGRRYLLVPLRRRLSPGELTYMVFRRRPMETNWFGVKKRPRF